MRYFISAIVIIALLLSPVKIFADSAADLQSQIDQKQAQILELEKQIASYQALVKSSQTQGVTLKQQIAKMEAQISSLEAQVKLTQTKISQTNLTISGLTSDIQTQSVALEKQKNEILRIAEFIGIQLSEKQLNFLCANLFGRTLTFRKGKIGEWNHTFKPEHIELFKQKLGETLIELGYESNNQWYTPFG